MDVIRTRTRKTELEYRARFQALFRRAQKALKRDPLSTDDFARWFLSLKGALSSSTIRGYRSACISALTDLSRAGPDYAAYAAPGLAILTKVDDATGRGAGPVPCAKADRQTSAKKRISLSLEQREAIRTALDGCRHKYVQLASGFMWFGPDLGLRPVEWHTAEVSGGFLIVQNAKHTNDRACGPTRVLNLNAFGEAYIRDLTAFLTRIKKAVEDEGGNWDKVAEGVRRALQDASRATGDTELRRRPVALYTLRHAACARMKAATKDLVEVAAMMGHATDETATTNYAHARHARGWPKFLARPSEQTILRVRKLFVSLKDRQALKLARADAASVSAPHL